jgi:hypothetical protein
MTISYDYFTYHGALRLKRIIENYWEKRGKFPAVRVERQQAGKEERPIYVVRSDLAFDERGFIYVNRVGASQ